MYSIDTNVFMDWWERRYPPDVFPSVQKAIEDLVSAGKLFAPERVREEINSVGSSALKQWIKNNKNIFVPHGTQLQTEANQIIFDYPDLVDTTTIHDEADRWVIALAKIKKCKVVTHETSVRSKKKPDRKLYMPDVCSAMKVPCIEFLDLLRQEKLSF